MSDQDHPCWPRLGRWPLLCVLGLALLPGPARAGCGDHLAPLGASAASGQQQSLPARSCTGAHCSRQDRSAPAPAPAPLTVVVNKAIVTGQPPVPPASVGRLPPDSDIRPTGPFSPLIYHPPR